jgi:isoaspartyl peptidase/L-asparaginase-like protein (Ntn-hydrolase superfamily)
MRPEPNAVLVIHGGAGVRPGHDYGEPAACMAEILARGGGRLRAGAPALDLVVEAVAAMEASGLFTAGKGSSPNRDGEVELDASVMTGHDRAAGAVAAVRNLVHPVRLALAVLRETPHVMLAGRGAEAFADAQGLERVSRPGDYYRAAVDRTRREGATADVEPQRHGTVGAVALDRSGHLAAATSTGGLIDKLPGRVGDTPLIGAATWADTRVAISCTGHGEYFIRTAAAHDLAARMAYQDVGLEIAAGAVIDAVGALGGDGGLIAVDREGHVAMPFNGGGMKRGVVRLDGEPEVAVH